MNNTVPDTPITLGKICSCYGILGWLRILSFTERAENIFNYKPWFIKKSNKWKNIELQNWCYINQRIFIKLKTIDNRDTAKSLTNCEIIVDSLQLPPLNEGNYYWRDLIGCQVITTEGHNFGKVVDVMQTGSNDVLVTQGNLRSRLERRLIPFLEGKIIKKVMLAAKKIEVDWLP